MFSQIRGCLRIAMGGVLAADGTSRRNCTEASQAPVSRHETAEFILSICTTKPPKAKPIIIKAANRVSRMGSPVLGSRTGSSYNSSFKDSFKRYAERSASTQPEPFGHEERTGGGVLNTMHPMLNKGPVMRGAYSDVLGGCCGYKSLPFEAHDLTGDLHRRKTARPNYGLHSVAIHYGALRLVA